MADIELVIKLNEDTYNTFKNLNQIIGVLSFEKDTLALIKAVKNGTPLPKGHGDLKDANVLESEMDKQFAYITSPLLDHVRVGKFYQLLYSTPTVISADKESEE